ncbi:uncharacterized protein LOC133782092 isoform X4 [Humulus lupulus]|uniref:uncharacterized protein LOC133782092 isoform X4 n=1 Tax=Humulus lupulus TaxID=3486 RepID=UPI002B411FD5|nr:uncharacterized protein LOC133782092 isoform X4 [Humulus lupulus]
MEVEERTKPFAIFMAFGTKGDVYPIAAIAAGFAFDQRQYHVILITHSAHESLRSHLAEKNVAYHPISSPPFTSTDHIQNTTESLISLQKKMLIRDHRRECYSVVEKTFGQRPRLEDDFIVINFFALEGWSLAELFRVRCIVAAPYVVPYSAPSSYERHFRKEHPLLYKYLQEAPRHKVCWEDVIHWMWPLFTEYWESWRRDLNLSSCPFTDPVTGLPEWHNRPSSPLLLYGFSKEVVECPEYWPSAVRVCGFWFLPVEWQFSCKNCGEISELVAAGHLNKKDELCSDHVYLQSFLKTRIAEPLVFVGLSSVGRILYQVISQGWCVLCKQHGETADHIFLDCSFSLELWFRVLEEFGLNWCIPYHCIEILNMYTVGGKRRILLWKVAVRGTWWWALWLERKKQIFDDKEDNVEFLWDKIKYWVAVLVIQYKGVQRGYIY